MAGRRKRDNDTAGDALDGGNVELSMERVAKEIYGESAPMLDTGRVVATPTRLDQIWFDLTQPRNLIPAAIRGRWDGNPSGIEDLLAAWMRKVNGLLEHGERYNAGAILRGEDFPDLDTEKQPAPVKTFIEIVELATSIRDSGLTNPVTVSKTAPTQYLLHTGERRLLAHYLLKMAHEGKADAGKWDKIAAVTQQTHDVWSQIRENTQRADMGAIAMARSLARLKMDMYAGEMAFGDYLDMVTDEGSDRPYYAQAASLRIKSGMGAQVLNALNTKSKGYISNYNNLLNLPDYYWVLADEEQWAERFLRDLLGLGDDVLQQAASEKWTETQIRDYIVQYSAPDKRFTMVNLGDDERQFTPVNPSGRFGSDRPAPGSDNTPSGSPTPPPRTTMGERAGLYDDAKAGPYPVDPGVVPDHEPRPVLTNMSSDADWKLYTYAPHPSELEVGETWDEEDERQAAEVDRIATELDREAFGEDKRLDNTPISLDAPYDWALELLVEAAKAMENPQSRQTIHFLRRRGREDIRWWMSEQRTDAKGYGERLDGEWAEVKAFIDALHARLIELAGGHMEVLLHEARRIYGDMD